MTDRGATPLPIDLAAADGSISYRATEGISPVSFYEQVRSLGGIAWDETMGAWIVVDYAYVKQILLDDVGFRHPYTMMKAGGSYMKIRSGNQRSSQFLTGEKHRAFHRWWLVELLSPRAIKAMQPMITGWIEQLLDDLASVDSVDLVDEFAERVPMGVFAELLDLPQRDRAYLDHIKCLNDEIAQFASVANALQLEGDIAPEAKRIADRAIVAGEELNVILSPLVHARRDGVGTDFISRLWAGGNRVFDDWNDLDTLDACRRLLFAGVDTTTHAIANAFHMLLTDADVMAKVGTGDAGLRGRFVEEVFRLNGSVQFRPRRASSPARIGEVDVAEGDLLIVALIGANIDGSHYGCPHEARLDRARPSDHFAFNYGARTCLGAHLARSELDAAIGQTLARYPNMILDTSKPAPQFSGFLMRSFRPIHVRLGDG